MATTRGVYLYDDEDSAIKDLANRDNRTISFVLGDLLRNSTKFQQVVSDYRKRVIKGKADNPAAGETDK
jgi:hypothetical protein